MDFKECSVCLCAMCTQQQCRDAQCALCNDSVQGGNGCPTVLCPRRTGKMKEVSDG